MNWKKLFQNFLNSLKRENDMALHKIFPYYVNLDIPRHWGLYVCDLTLSGYDMVCSDISKVAKVTNMQYLPRNDYCYELLHTRYINI